MAITTAAQTIVVDGVEDVIVTLAELDTGTGDYVREIRLVGADEVVLFTLRMMASDRVNIDITVPESEF